MSDSPTFWTALFHKGETKRPVDPDKHARLVRHHILCKNLTTKMILAHSDMESQLRPVYEKVIT